MSHPRRIETEKTRTKIVCTIGPASHSFETIRSLALAGADVFRLNFSHGSHQFHAATIRMVREVSREFGRPYAVLGDLSGPKIRLGDIAAGGMTVKSGDILVLTGEEASAGSDRLQVNFEGFARVVQPGHKIMLDDGNLQFVVQEVDGENVRCLVVDGGFLKSRKGVNLPDTVLPIPAMTEKDHEDMQFALREGVDLLALSFVRDAQDIIDARAAMERYGRKVPLLAKIEKKEAVDTLDAIIREADGAMVARGDLGIEIPMEEVPAAQKRIIRLCNRYAKPVITATQMLESMIVNPRPTRAEVTDIYNAILDGTDAVMLSGETAAGAWPVEAVEVMSTVASEAEKAIGTSRSLEYFLNDGERPTITEVICHAAVQIAESLRVDLIIVPTESGFSARNVARFRPSVPVFACSTIASSVNGLCLTWGVTPRLMQGTTPDQDARFGSDALVAEVVRTAQYYDIARTGQRAVVIGGAPPRRLRHTNYVHVIEVG